MSTKLLTALGAAIALLSGCSTYAVPHQPYTPLLDRGGQVDISANAQVSGGSAPSVAVHGAYAPIDHLEIVAGVDADFVNESDSSDAGSYHFAGELGIGTFAVENPTLKAELIGGVGFGWGQGVYSDLDDVGGTTTNVSYQVDGPYIRPFLQGTVANVAGNFEWGGGIRLAYTWASLSFDPRDASSPARPGMDGGQYHIDPFVMSRVRFDYVALEALGGLSISPGDLQVGPVFNAFVSVGVHVWFDTQA